MSLSALSTAPSGQPFSIKTGWLFFWWLPLLPSALAPSTTYFSLSFTPQKVAFEFFKERGAIELEQKPRIADYWALMRSTPSLRSSRKHLMLFLFGPENWPGLKEMRGGKAEKETEGEREGEREGEGRRGKVVVHSTMCVLQACVVAQKKRGREG